MIRKWQQLELHKKILLIGAIIFLMSFLVTWQISRQFGRTLAKANETYVTNRQLNATQKVLTSVRRDIVDYLDSGSQATLADYYEHAAQWREQMSAFNTAYSADATLMMEKDVFYLASDYLEGASDAIVAKQRRDIDAYQQAFSALEKKYTVLTDLLTALNSRRFEENAIGYDAFLRSAEMTKEGGRILLLLIAVMGLLLMFLLNRISENGIREKGVIAENQIKDAELKYLRAQINPHFLFNTLNAGAQLAMMEDADRTYHYIHKVADFYRYTARQNSQETTIAQEVASIDDYMYIINVRFKGEIDYEKIIDSKHLDDVMPGMTLQPIVENAFKHGLTDEVGEKKIRLTIRDEAEGVCIRIADSGVGIEEGRIAELLTKSIGEHEISETGRGAEGLASGAKGREDLDGDLPKRRRDAEALASGAKGKEGLEGDVPERNRDAEALASGAKGKEGLEGDVSEDNRDADISAGEEAKTTTHNKEETSVSRQSRNTEGEGLGIPSIRERLERYYEKENVMEIVGHSDLGGAEVILHLPIRPVKE